MNILLLLEWLLQDAEKHEKVLLRKVSIWQDPRQVLLDDLTALNHGRQVELPAGLPDEPEDLIQCLRGHFHDEVTLISRVLSEKKNRTASSITGCLRWKMKSSTAWLIFTT